MSNDGPGIPPSHSRISLAVLMQNRLARKTEIDLGRAAEE
jgi:hypothetical protein